MPRPNQRKHFIVDLPFQTAFICKFTMIVIGASFLIGAIVFIYAQNSTTVAIEKTKIFAKPTSDFIFPVIALTVLLVSLAAAVSVGFLTLFISHRIAGPVFRLKREIHRLQEGALTANFSIREKDQLKDLANALQEMSDTICGRQLALKKNCAALVDLLKKNDFSVGPADRATLQKIVEDIQGNLNYFKT